MRTYAQIILLLYVMLITSCNKKLDVENIESNDLIPSNTPPISSAPIVDEILIPASTKSPIPTLTIVPRDYVTDIKVENFDNPSDKQVSTEIFQLCSPLASEEISQLEEIISDPYNPPAPNREERHHGIDFSYYRRNDREGIEGEGIQSILAGSVAAVVFNRLPYGNMVIIESSANLLPQILREKLKLDNGKSLYTLYAHMKDAPGLEIGEEVNCGQKLGVVGSTGYNIVNPHLHLETRVGEKGVKFESMVFYDTSALPFEMENYRRWRTSGDFIHFDPILLFQFYLGYEKEN